MQHLLDFLTAHVLGGIINKIMAFNDDIGVTDVHCYFSDRDTVSITVNPDTDEVELKLVPASDPSVQSISHNWSSICNEFVGRSVDWVWVAKHQQGYSDTLALGVDSNTPTIIFTAICSAIIVSLARSIPTAEMR